MSTVTARPDAALLTHAVELAPDGVLIVDTDGVIVYANRSMHRMSGADELVGKRVEDLVPEVVRARHADLRKEYTSRPVQRPMGADLELAMRRVDGTLIPVEISLSPFEHGESYVIKSANEFQVVSHNPAFADDDSSFNGSPAISNGQLFVRSESKLYCIGAD